VNINLQIIQAQFGASVVVSSTGIGACGSLDGLRGGFGYKWGQSPAQIAVMLGSCDLTPYETVVSAQTAARAAAVGATITVPGGEPSEMIKVVGRGGPPDIAITAPNGLHASTTGQTSVTALPFVIRRSPSLSTTYIAIIHPRAGSYTITANPGSPAMAPVLDGHGITPSVRAQVTGHGVSRRLTYTTNQEPGQTVTFVERGTDVDKLIGSSTRSHGALTFTPAPGPGGVRQIVASLTQNGSPVVLGRTGQITVARYRKPGPRRLGRVTGLRAARSGDRVTVSFRRVPGARQYVVVVEMRDGLHTDPLLRTGRARFTVPRTGASGGTAVVHALGDHLTTVDGPLATAELVVPKAPPKHKHKPPKKHHT
jgi:hypothetical protein